MTEKFESFEGVLVNGKVEEIWNLYKKIILETSEQMCGMSIRNNNRKQIPR